MPPRRSARVSAAASAAPKSRASSISDLSCDFELSEADYVAPRPPSSRKRTKAGSAKPKPKATAKSQAKVSKKPTSYPSSDESDWDPGLTPPPPKRRKIKAASPEATAEASAEPANRLLTDAGSDFVLDSPPRRRKAGKSKAILIPPSSDVESDFEPISPPHKRRRTRASLTKSEEEVKDFPDTERGGPAAMEVYCTLDIFQNILSLVDKATLAGMLRLEKAVTTSVSAVLYKTVHVSQITRMSRGSPRRVIYCDAVKVLDINPAPFTNAGKPSRRRGYRHTASPFHPSLLQDLPLWRKKLPNLHTIIRDRPSSKVDEPFTVHISGKKITVEVETAHEIIISTFPTTGTPVLPSSPKFPGYTIRHSIALTVSGGFTTGIYSYATGTQLPDVPDATLGAWHNWLFTDPTLDPRISRISLERCLMKVSFNEITSFISQRNASVHILSFTLPPIEGITLAQLRQIATLLGPQLRNLFLPSSVVNAINDWPGLIDLIDSAFPSLRQLVVSNANEIRSQRSTSPPIPSIPSSARLSGLPKLREFSFPTSYSDDVDQLALARSIHGIGSAGCIFHPSGLYNNTMKEAFNRLVFKLKSSNPRYAPLHTLQSKDLDLTHASAFQGHSFEPTKGHFRRAAWNTTSTYTTELATQQDKLEGLVAKQKAAVEAYQATLARTTDGLGEAGGDVKEENKVLKREFEKVLKDQAEMAAACQAMKAAAADMEAKSRIMSVYAQTWLSANKEDGKAAKGT